ncbi:MAG TPA: hypothetical protein VGF35_05090 [Steroidobacteraceae bacterium]|jgi:hypothetical protein
MSVNIGTDGVQAVQELRGNREFERLLDALEIVAGKFHLSAIDSPPEFRVDQTAYARGMIELWQALRAAWDGTKPNTVKPSLGKAVGRTTGSGNLANQVNLNA